MIGVPQRSYRRWQAKARKGNPPKGPWPAPAVDALEAVVAKYCADWPAWGDRKIWGLMRADGIRTSMSTVERTMRRRGLLQPIDYQGERREHAKARKAAFAQPPDGRNQVWQLDFSEYETTTGGTWRLAGCCDYFSKYEYGWHIASTCTGADAITAVRLAIAEAETLAGDVPLVEQLPINPETGKPKRIKLVTDNGGAFKGHAFAAFIASRTEFLHIRTRRRSPGQNGVRERAFGSLKYEHLYRQEIETLPDLHREAEAYRQVFNKIRPHEALGFLPANRGASRCVFETSTEDHSNPTFNRRILSQILDAGHLRAENAELKRRLRLTSRDSSKPQSADGPVKPPPKSRRGPSSRLIR